MSSHHYICVIWCKLYHFFFSVNDFHLMRYHFCLKKKRYTTSLPYLLTVITLWWTVGRLLSISLTNGFFFGNARECFPQLFRCHVPRPTDSLSEKSQGRRTNVRKPPYKDGEIAPVAVARKQGARAKVTLAPISG